MHRVFVASMLIITAFVATACNGGRQDASQPLEIVLKSQPDPPTMGENTFDVEVRRGTTPVTDATVSVELYMAAMPSMNMAENRSSVPLSHEGGGRYRGKGNVAMAGSWDATVRVSRGGQEIGTRKITLTAK